VCVCAPEDNFNLYGLRSVVPNYRECIDMILDFHSNSEEEPDDWSGELLTSARDLYGLIHARFILTTRGLQLMVRCACACARACVRGCLCTRVRVCTRRRRRLSV
jgi:hypothetical protein